MAADPPFDWGAARSSAFVLGYAGGFRRERPALAEIPARHPNLVPIHHVGADAAEQIRRIERPAVLAALHERPWIEEAQIASRRIGEQPDRRTAASVPVLHDLHPLVLRRRRQVLAPRRQAIVLPDNRATHVELLTAIHGERGWNRVTTVLLI